MRPARSLVGLEAGPEQGNRGTELVTVGSRIIGWARWLVPLAVVALGLFVLRLSLRAYAKWQEYLALGDYSGAEAYEVEFWPEVVIAMFLTLLGGFLAGRWSVGRRPR